MFSKFEEVIGYTFKDKDMLKQAFTHSSYAHENKMDSLSNNERLEFLGDAVLELVISDKLFRIFTDLPEGELTKFRAALVCEGSLAKEAFKIDLGDHLFMGKGEEISGGRNRESTLSDTFEAVIGAIFLDGGLKAAKEFILKMFEEEIERGYGRFPGGDYKTALQEEIQKVDKDGVGYEIVSEIGPAHDKTFIAKAVASDKEIGRGSGKSKKEAEQCAAYNALAAMGLISVKKHEGMDEQEDY
jgi:ribonuclease-3